MFLVESVFCKLSSDYINLFQTSLFGKSELLFDVA